MDSNSTCKSSISAIMNFSVNESINAILLIPIQLVNRQFLPLMTFSVDESINTVFAESRDSKLTVPVFWYEIFE